LEAESIPGFDQLANKERDVVGREVAFSRWRRDLFTHRSRSTRCEAVGNKVLVHHRDAEITRGGQA
jgi:hypothetical protein